jgi:hypothetical protein
MPLSSSNEEDILNNLREVLNFSEEGVEAAFGANGTIQTIQENQMARNSSTLSLWGKIQSLLNSKGLMTLRSRIK